MTSPLSLAQLGWDRVSARDLRAGEEPARVASVYSARVELWTERGAHLAALRSRAFRDAAPEGGIAVGDWVAAASAGGDELVVERVLPRRTVFLRQAAGERSSAQAIAANIDTAFIVSALDGDFSTRRLERYLVALRGSGAFPVIVLTKADLATDLEAAVAEAKRLAPTLVTSTRSGVGIGELRAAVPPGDTAALVGSSGVGKSALVNALLGSDAQLEGAVREHDRRGKHTTTRRLLLALPGGGLLVDTPGMRELKPWEPRGGEDDETFEDVVALAEGCRYRDCTHGAEPGCRVQDAVRDGVLDAARVLSFAKLEAERARRASRQKAAAGVADDRKSRAAATARDRHMARVAGRAFDAEKAKAKKR